MNNELITTLANVALTLSVIIAVIFGVAQVKTSNRDRKERLTLETLRNFQTREFAEMILHITTQKMPSSFADWQSLSLEERVILVQFAQQMESLGMLVAEKYIDLDLVDKTLGSFVMTSWEKYKVLFLDMRVKTEDPFLAEYFQWLAERIDERMKRNPREPFFESNRNVSVR